jgi:hypothetical protein
MNPRWGNLGNLGYLSDQLVQGGSLFASYDIGPAHRSRRLSGEPEPLDQVIDIHHLKVRRAVSEKPETSLRHSADQLQET